jgi:hypothetical protein
MTFWESGDWNRHCRSLTHSSHSTACFSCMWWKGLVVQHSFKLSRGVKQDCPLLTDLFIMAPEMLAIKIRSNNNIKGLEIQGLRTKVSLYADDSCFLLNPQLRSLHSLRGSRSFSNLSGLQPNDNKCTILSIGSQKRLLWLYRVVYQWNCLMVMWYTYPEINKWSHSNTFS